MIRTGTRRGGSATAFLAVGVVVLVILAGVGFGLYLTKPSVVSTTADVMAMATAEPAMSFVPASNVVMQEDQGHPPASPCGLLRASRHSDWSFGAAST